MRIKELLCLCLLLWTSSGVYSQSVVKIRIYGTVTDSVNNEPLQGAVVVNRNIPQEATLTDESGSYSLLVTPGNCTLQVNYVGYETKTLPFVAEAEKQQSFALSPKYLQSKEVVVTTKRSDKNIRNTEMSRVELTGEQIKKLPVLFGETDVLKTITLMPGIKSGGEGSTGFYVRGGGPDQNLIMLDNGVVYNAAHLLGFFSVFNGDIVKNVEVIKGGIPANYGGRLSSILNVEMKEGDYDKHHLNGGIGLISSRLSADGPIQKGKSSYLVAGRRTYLDAIAQPVLPDSLKGNKLYFYDLNGKFSFRLTDKDKLTISAYYGRDAFNYKPPRRNDFQFGVNWGNTLVSARYSRIMSKKVDGNFTVSYNAFDLSSRIQFGDGEVRVSSGLKDWNGKAEISIRPSVRTRIKTGISYIFHTFEPGILTAQQKGQDLNSEISNQYAHEGALFYSMDHEVSTRFSLHGGLRYSWFNQVGPYKKMIYAENGIRTGNIIQYKGGESIAFWDGLEPRFAARYSLSDNASVKASYTRTFQYLHLATSSSATLPSDLWVPSSQKVRPQLADQVALGYFHNFKDDMYETSVELYYKSMQNQIEFKPGAELFFNQNLENEMIFGKGLSYGAEFFIRKTKGRTTGWIGYTWSKTTRTFAELNGGNPYFYRYDRRHDISVVVTHSLNKKWEVNFVFVYGTGNTITLPPGRFIYDVGYNRYTHRPAFSILDLYTDANTYRMPAYHRADVSVTYSPHADKQKRFKSSWNFSIYNLYNRKNPFFIYLDTDQDKGKIVAKMVYLFPILPSVTWNFKF